MRNLLLTNNVNSSALTANAVIPLGSAVHGYGKAIRLINNAIVLNECGYYDIMMSANINGTGTVSIQMYENGQLVSGAIATTTLDATTASSSNLTIPYIIRKGCDSKSITFVISASATVNNIIVTVGKE